MLLHAAFGWSFGVLTRGAVVFNLSERVPPCACAGFFSDLNFFRTQRSLLLATAAATAVPVLFPFSVGSSHWVFVGAAELRTGLFLNEIAPDSYGSSCIRPFVCIRILPEDNSWGSYKGSLIHRSRSEKSSSYTE